MQLRGRSGIVEGNSYVLPEKNKVEIVGGWVAQRVAEALPQRWDSYVGGLLLFRCWMMMKSTLYTLCWYH